MVRSLRYRHEPYWSHRTAVPPSGTTRGGLACWNDIQSAAYRYNDPCVLNSACPDGSEIRTNWHRFGTYGPICASTSSWQRVRYRRIRRARAWAPLTLGDVGGRLRQRVMAAGVRSPKPPTRSDGQILSAV